MSNDDTIFNNVPSNENTCLGPMGTSNNVTPPPFRGSHAPCDPMMPQAPAPAEGGKWQKVAIGGAMGLVFGGAAVGLMSFANNPGEEDVKPDNGNPLVDNDISIAHNVNDNMTFSQAFAAARAEVGPGGCFEWHGQLYGTYYASEWDAMTPAERGEWDSHFAWSNGGPDYNTSADLAGNNGGGNAAAAAAAQNNAQANAQANAQTNNEPQTMAQTGGTTAGGAINTTSDYVSGDNPQGAGNDMAMADTGNHSAMDNPNQVEVLGVVHDSETDANLAFVDVDDTPVVFVDVDNDLTFDLMGVDDNHNGTFEEHEISDVSGMGMTVTDLGGFTDGHDAYASRDFEPTDDSLLADDMTGTDDPMSDLSDVSYGDEIM